MSDVRSFVRFSESLRSCNSWRFWEEPNVSISMLWPSSGEIPWSHNHFVEKRGDFLLFLFLPVDDWSKVHTPSSEHGSDSPSESARDLNTEWNLKDRKNNLIWRSTLLTSSWHHLYETLVDPWGVGGGWKWPHFLFDPMNVRGVIWQK